MITVFWGKNRGKTPREAVSLITNVGLGSPAGAVVLIQH